MANFNSYEDRDNRRRDLILGAATALGIGLAFPAVRRNAVNLLFRGLERVGSQSSRFTPPLKARSTLSEMEALLGRALPRAAQLSYASEQAETALTNAIIQRGALAAEDAQRFASRFARGNSFRDFLAGGARAHDELFGSAEFHAHLDEFAQAIHARRGTETLEFIRQREATRIEDAIRGLRDRIPTVAHIVEHPTDFPLYHQSHQRLQALMQQELKRQGMWEKSFMGRLGNIIGVRPVTLSDPAGQQLLARENLGALLDRYTLRGLDAHQLPVGGVFHIGENIYDLRGFGEVRDRATRWMAEHFQVPIAPGIMGFSPVRLGPWFHGKLDRTFAHISSEAVDTQLRAMLGTPGPTVGADVFHVGQQAMAVDFTQKLLAGETLADSIRVLPVQGQLRSGIYGYLQNQRKEMEAALAAKDAGGAASFRHWIGLGNQYGDSQWTRIASVARKFRDPTWGPNVFGRLLTDQEGNLSAQDVQRVTSILTRAELSPDVRRRMVEHAVQQGLFSDSFAGGLLSSVEEQLQTLGSDKSALSFFRDTSDVATQDSFKSRRMRELVNQYRVSPRSVLNRYEPAVDHSVFGYNFLGRPDDKHGIDLMREAVLGEIEARMRMGEDVPESAFLDFLKGTNLSDRDRMSALAYGHGKIMMERMAGGEKGYLEAIRWLRESPQAQAVSEQFLAQRFKPWDAYTTGAGQGQPFLNTGELFLQNRFSFIEQMNKNLKGENNWLGAFWETVRGPFGQQYASVLTGNQKYFTSDTLAGDFFLRKLNHFFQSTGLGLPAQDLYSGGSILGNLMLKRIIPAVGLVESYRYADYKLRSAGLGGPSDAYANIRGHLGVGRARLTGDSFLGMGRRELFPGLEKYFPERDEEEERQHQLTGYEPVRKGRFWFLGSRSEAFGDKIDYFLPSAVNVARSDWQGAENVDLSTRAYWAHSAIPLPENFFLGPIAAVLDPHWWEKRHSMGPAADRPYVVTGQPFDPNTLHGPFLNATIGQILKPTRVLYPEYLPRSAGGSASREDLTAINRRMKAGADLGGLGLLVGGAGGGSGAGGGGGFGGGGSAGLGAPGVLGGGPGLGGSLALVSPGGMISTVMVPGGISYDEWAEMGRSSIQGPGRGARLARSEISRINRLAKAGMGGLTPKRLSNSLRMATQTGPFNEEDLDLIDYENGLITGTNTATEIAGLYGWMARSAIPFKQRNMTVATPSRAYGFERRFYDLSFGGIGGELSEVGRRFLPHRMRRDEWNPVPNQMPSWLPGSEYFLDFRHGDPYVKIPRGEIRLPGEAYERVHNVRLMDTRASSLGHSVEEMMQEMLFLDEPFSAQGEFVTETGDVIHRMLQRKWKRMGVLLGAEQRIYDEKLGISGHFDAILATENGPELGEIKTVSGKRFREALKHPFAEHLSQMNFYLYETGLRAGNLMYVNRDDPRQVHVYHRGFDPADLQRSISRVQSARQRLMGMVEDSQIGRGDLYDPVSRFEILADVAPYSANYAQLREYLIEKNRDGQISPEENVRFQAAKKRVAQQKRRISTYPYRFRGMHLKDQVVTVDQILDPNTFTVAGSENPIRLAGVRSSGERIQEVLGETPDGRTPAEQQFERFGIYPGARIRIQTEADPKRAVADDTLRTQHAVVYGQGGNVNRQLLSMGIAEERETDYSDTGVAARFSGGDIFRGKLWEAFAHMDTPFHTKWLRVRSPREELERGIVFGKETGSWNHPLRDYVFPTIESYASKNPIWGAAATAAFATFFFKTTSMKQKALLAGAALGATLPILRAGYELMTDETCKPGRTRTREELEEYWDTLKYVKARGLASYYERLARQKEGVNVEKMAREIYREGEQHKKRLSFLESEKRRLILDDKEKNREEISDVQRQIDAIGDSSVMMKLGPYATKALQYREQFRSTLYGIDPGATPFVNLFRAFPKYKRELITQWIEKSDEKERHRIFDLLPRAEQRVLGKYLGVDESEILDRPKLRDYFQQHPLPDANWAGWRPDVDLEALRLRAIKGEGLDPFESAVYPVQIEDAERETSGVPVPTIEGTSAHIQQTLNQLLSGKGLHNVHVRVDLQPREGNEDDLRVHVELRQHREQEIRRHLQLDR